MALVEALSRRTGISVADLVRSFGQHLLARFTVLYPAMFAHHHGLFDLLAAIDNHIHVEVRKLYAEARLPRFQVLDRDHHCLRLLYRSPRSMEALAQGLIEGAAAHFGEPCRVTSQVWRSEADDPGTVFTITRQV